MERGHEKEQSPKDLVAPLVRMRASTIDEQSILSSESSLERNHGNSDLKDDVRHFAMVAEACYKLGIDADHWDARVKALKETKKAEALEHTDIITAIEIEETYMEYLFDTDRFEEAVQIALHLTDGYSVPHPDERPMRDRMTMDDFMQRQRLHMQYGQFSRKQSEVLVDVAGRLIEKGELDRAQELVTAVDLNTQGYGYFAHLLKHYKERQDLKGITSFMNDMEQRMEAVQQSDDEIAADMGFRFLRALYNESKQLLADEQKQSGNIEETIRILLEIQVPHVRLSKLTELTADLFEKGDIEQARRAATMVLDEIHAGSSYQTKDKTRGARGKHALIGDISFAPENPQDKEKEFDPYHTIEERIALAEVIGGKKGLEDIFARCIDGDDEDGRYSVLELIKLVDSQYQSTMWGYMIRLYGNLEDWNSVQEMYTLACESNPDSLDYFQSVVAETKTDVDLGEAERLILEIPDKERRAVAYADFIFEKFYKHGEQLQNWKAYLDRLISMENEILKPEEKEEEWNLSSLTELNEADVDEDVEDDENITTVVSSGSLSFGFMSMESKFWRRSSGVMANLAKVALKRSNFDVYGELLNDPRMENYMAVTLMKESASWATGERPIKFWY